MVTAEEFVKLIWNRLDPNIKKEEIENINIAIGLTVDTLRNLRFRIQGVKILVVIFPEELGEEILDDLKDDFNIDFPSSIIYRIEPDVYAHLTEKNKIGIIVPESDVDGVKEFFNGYKIEDKYNLYISEEIK